MMDHRQGEIAEDIVRLGGGQRQRLLGVALQQARDRQEGVGQAGGRIEVERDLERRRRLVQAPGHHVDQRHAGDAFVPTADPARLPCASVRALRRTGRAPARGPGRRHQRVGVAGASSSARRNDASAAVQSQSWPCLHQAELDVRLRPGPAPVPGRAARPRGRARTLRRSARSRSPPAPGDPRQPRPRQREIRVERERLPEQLDRLVGVGLRGALDRRTFPAGRAGAPRGCRCARRRPRAPRPVACARRAIRPARRAARCAAP